jgi:hypothetical protein
MLAVLILGAVFLFYYFPVTAGQEVTLNDRAFRSLAVLGDQLNQSIGGYASALRYAAEQIHESQLPDFLRNQVPGLAYRSCNGLDATLSDMKFDLSLSIGLLDQRNYLKYRYRKAQKGSEVCAVASLDNTLAPFLSGMPEGLFDEVLVADSEGQVLFQENKAGIRVSNLAPLFSENAKQPAGENSAKAVADTNRPTAETKREVV